MLGNLDRRFGAVAAANAGDMNPQRFEFANHRRGDGILPAEDGDLADRGPAQVAMIVAMPSGALGLPKRLNP